MTQRLNRSASVTLNASGAGTLVIGPGKPNERWRISRITTSGNSGLNPSLHIYRGAANGDLIDYTKRGNSAISENNPPVDLMAGEVVTCVYSSGSSGGTMDLYFEGEVTYAIPS